MRFYLWSFIGMSLALVAAIPQSPAPFDDPEPFFFKGHDLSSLKMLEEGGCIYKDTERKNVTRPAEAILGDGGMNSVRLRIWVNPVGGTYGLEYNLDLAKRFRDEGYKIYLDFHFSDSWADPNKQPPPAAWPKVLTPLASTLREYVRETLVSFHEAGITLDLVSLGNEIRHGILWPVGYADVDVEPWSSTVKNFSNLATLWKAARAGVDDAINAGISKPTMLIHIDDGWNLTLQQRWFGALTANGVPTTAWDAFGFSFYPFYGTAATFDNLRTTLNTLAQEYKKPLHVVETDYPAICNGEWEPAWLNNTSLGSDCNDAILFTADYSNWPQTVGYSRPSVNMYLKP